MAGAAALLLGDLDQEGIAHHLGVEHQGGEVHGLGLQAVDQVIDGGDRHQGGRRQHELVGRAAGLHDLGPELAALTLDAALELTLAAVLDLHGAEAEGVAALGLEAIELGGEAHLPRCRKRDLRLDVALEMPAGAIERQVVDGGTDAGRVGRQAEPQGIFRAVRLHLRFGHARDEHGACEKEAHKTRHRSTLRTARHRVNRAHHEFA